MAKSYLDKTGLALVWAKIKELVATKVDKVDGKGLSTNDYTSNEKTKLAGIATGAQTNVLEGIQKNGTTVSVTNKIANITVPTKTSDITNDSGYITTSSVPTATTTTPKMDGTASVGTETKWAKGDHIHPSDTTRVPTTRKVNGHALSADVTVTKNDIGLGNVDNTADSNKVVASAGKLTTATNLEGISFDGTTGTSYYATCSTAAATAAKEATISGQTFNLVTGARVIVKFTYANSATSSTLDVNGTGAKPIYYNGAAIGKSVTDANGTYEFVYNGTQWELIGDLDTNTSPSAASATPNMDGTAAVGTSAKYAREDHVHPSDTTKVDKVDGKGLSTNDYTTTEKNKLSGIASGAQVNVIETIKVNNTALTPSSKAVNITVPTKTSDITNDSGFITISDVPEGAVASTTTPNMDGTASAGTEVAFARGDHVHPSDTTKVDKVDGKGLSTNDYTNAEKTKLGGIATGAEVNQNAFANITVGSTTIQADAKQDTLTFVAGDNITLTPDSTNDKITIAATDTTYSDVTAGGASGLMTGVDKTKLNGIATGAEVNQNAFSNVKVGSTTVAADAKTDTIEFVAGSNITITPDATNDKITIAATDTTYTAASATPNMDGTAAVGTSVKYAREDHVHPSDTSRVPTSRKVNGKALSSDITLSASDVSAVATSAVGAANGVCPLNSNSVIDSQYLPSFVDDIVEAYARTSGTALGSDWLSTASATGSALTPETGKIYVLMADSGDYAANTQFRWSGSAYVKLNDGGVSPITNEEINTICV